MTRAYLEHRCEQMEAFRRDFELEWNPIRRTQRILGEAEKDLAVLEMKVWRAWIRQFHLAEFRPELGENLTATGALSVKEVLRKIVT